MTWDLPRGPWVCPVPIGDPESNLVKREQLVMVAKSFRELDAEDQRLLWTRLGLVKRAPVYRKAYLGEGHRRHERDALGQLRCRYEAKFLGAQ
jgi:hypothetical protein